MKNNLWKILSVVAALLFCVGAGIIGYAVSPLHPRNVTDETVIRKGTEYTVKLSGVSEYDETGFFLTAENFYYVKEDVGVFVDEDGFAYTDYTDKGDIQMNGEYCSAFVKYEDYSFCGETYKSREELEEFFETPDRIYNFDINNLSGYIQDIVSYEKQFSGKMTVRIYRKKCVITDIYIGKEKILVHNEIV